MERTSFIKRLFVALVLLVGVSVYSDAGNVMTLRKCGSVVCKIE